MLQQLVQVLVLLEGGRTCRRICCLVDSHDYTGGIQCLAGVTDRTHGRTLLHLGSLSGTSGTSYWSPSYWTSAHSLRLQPQDVKHSMRGCENGTVFSWDFPFQLPMRHPGPHCRVTHSMTRGIWLSISLSESCNSHLDRSVVLCNPQNPHLSALAKLSPRKEARLPLRFSPNCLLALRCA